MKETTIIIGNNRSQNPGTASAEKNGSGQGSSDHALEMSEEGSDASVQFVKEDIAVTGERDYFQLRFNHKIFSWFNFVKLRRYCFTWLNLIFKN